MKPFLSYSIVVRGRVASKSNMRAYDNDQHKVFFFDLMDASSVIRVKAFDLACDQIFANLRVGQVLDVFCKDK